MVDRSVALGIGFILLHLGGALTALSFAYPNWVHGPTFNATESAMMDEPSVANKTSKGLWQKCTNCFDCELNDFDDQPVWFLAFLALYTAGLFLTDIAILLSYCLCFCPFENQKRVCLNVCIIILTMLAVGCEGTAIAVFAMKGLKESDDMNDPLERGWAFWTAIGGCGLTMFSCICFGKDNCFLQSSEQRAYANIYNKAI